ncbi:MAG TPA: sigma-70 family RNA polymerase sigma factor, partial [Thermoanaerobaculia bacterium]|nr:sigma-70 family RNA polymerase sigma factor [Thermoanaerobaculia bacterium]
METADLFLQNLSTIERIAAFICRRNHVRDDDAAEFTAEVRLRLIENDYAIIRKFEGRSSFSTYLTTVITRLYHQYRIEQWGKWRPSAEAKRLGDKAITLERLLTRDGYTFTEAVSILTTRAGGVYTVVELESIYVRLPSRQPRPVLVNDDVSADAASTPAVAEEQLQARDRERTVRTAAQAIDRVIAALSPEDRLILRMRFWGTCKVPEIAR